MFPINRVNERFFSRECRGFLVFPGNCVSYVCFFLDFDCGLFVPRFNVEDPSMLPIYPVFVGSFVAFM